MIAQLHGCIAEIAPPSLILNVHGVGYELDLPLTDFHHLPAIGQHLALYTHLIVREDAHNLYGFLSKPAQQLFKLLLKVNGIGPRAALTILSHHTPVAIAQFIMNHDIANLTTIPGIGKKTAERLVMESKDWITSWAQQNLLSPQTTTPMLTPALQDAVAALIALGYKGAIATKIATKITTPDMSTEMIIKLALRELSI